MDKLEKSVPRFKAPQVLINRVYTRGGDTGQTSLVGGDRVDKDDARIEAYGTVDELNAFVGVARTSAERLAGEHPELAQLSDAFLRVQHELFNLGSGLATVPDKLGASQATVRAEDVARLEAEIDGFNAQLGALRSFVLPGGTRLSAELHVCRTVCRRVERLCVALSRAAPLDPVVLGYINRLSDALFVWSRWADKIQQQPETLWNPNAAKTPNP